MIPNSLNTHAAADSASPVGVRGRASLQRRRPHNGSFYRFLSADPSGRYLIFNAGRTSGTLNGSIDDERVIRLRPANGSNIRYETW